MVRVYHERPLLMQVGIRARKKEGGKEQFDLMCVRKTNNWTRCVYMC